MRDRDSPIINILTLRRDLYLVLSLLLADKNVAEVPGVVFWTKTFHEDEVRRLMLWIATAMRGLLDLLDREKDDFSDRYCGEYRTDLESGTGTALTFRQACNSIIHAKEILPYRVPLLGSEGTIKQIYSDRITIRSTHGKRKTRANLDIIEFVQIADTLMILFEEDNRADR